MGGIRHQSFAPRLASTSRQCSGTVGRTMPAVPPLVQHLPAGAPIGLPAHRHCLRPTSRPRSRIRGVGAGLPNSARTVPDFRVMWIRLRTWSKQHPIQSTCAVSALVIASFIGLFAEAPWWMDAARLHTLGRTSIAAQHSALDEDRSQVLKIVAGLGALVALIYTARKHSLDRRAHALEEQGQITDRYIKAVEQLGSPGIAVRMGGIYALGRIMKDSDADRWTVAEVLAAYLRQHSPTGQTGSTPPVTPPSDENLGVDLGAALIVLARSEVGERNYGVDLRYTNLSRIEILQGSGLEGANMAYSNLHRANLVRVSLARVNFYRANLSRIGILASDLSDAQLVEADLTNALLHGSTCAGTLFLRADLTGANLLSVDLSLAKELTAEQLSKTGIDASTQLPPTLRDDPWVHARLADCATWATAWNWDSLPPPAPTARPMPSPPATPPAGSTATP